MSILKTINLVKMYGDMEKKRNLSTFILVIEPSLFNDMETFLNNLSFLCNRQSKNEFTYDIHRYDPILIDENLLDIYNRVESLLRIIKGNRVVDALKMVIEYDTDTMYDIYAQQEAIYLLSLINKGKILLPEFN